MAALHLFRMPTARDSMNIQEYFSKLNEESQSIFKQSILAKDQLGQAHHFASCIFEISEFIPDPLEKDMFVTVSTQLESATLNLALGMYRQAFASLRLALEMGLGAIHFSVHKMELNEWLDGRADIRWSSLIDGDNGVLSIRFSNAFFKELSSEMDSYRSKTISTYRKLSEYVHGNNETWVKSGLKVSYNKELIDAYFSHFKVVSEVIVFISTCRYIKQFDAVALESLQFIPEELSHIPVIREIFGGSKA
jgi:hypothetical protein